MKDQKDPNSPEIKDLFTSDDEPKRRLDPDQDRTGAPRFSFWPILFLIFMFWLWMDAWQAMNIRTISYSNFKEMLRLGHIQQVVISEAEIEGRVNKGLPKTPPPAEEKEEPAAKSDRPTDATENANVYMFRTVRVEDPELIAELEEKNVEYVGERPSYLTQILLTWLLPLGIMVFLWIYISRRFGAMRQTAFGIGKAKMRHKPDRDTRVSFDDVAGCDEAKYELQEVVEFLREPAKYEQLGAKIPKGVLLVGPPGTGKTLLARAVAGEAKVPFFSMSGSEFVEMFVGVGASRIRDLFEQAKKEAPAIIFVDELDAIGRQRGIHVGAVNDEREQTLNQLLVELDGFSANTGVIVLAATNRPDVLDPALLRPGRFDRQVIVDAPDVHGREAILKVHAKGKPLADDVDLTRIARLTPGFSGADLANMLNEAALLAVREGQRKVFQKHIQDAIEKVVAGPERRSRRLTDKERRLVAFHEVGHALVAFRSKNADPVHKVTIVPRGKAALGYTMQLPTSDRSMLSQAELWDRIKVALGGRAAEEIVFAEVTTGSENDLEHATALARRMVCTFGMGKSMGLVHCGGKTSPFLAVQVPNGQLQRDCSEASAREIDIEVKAMLDRAYEEARGLVLENREQLNLIAEELLDKETLDEKTFKELAEAVADHDLEHIERIRQSSAKVS